MTKDQKNNLIAYFAIALSDAYTYGLAQSNLEYDTVKADRARHKSMDEFLSYLQAIELTEVSPLTKDQKKKLLFHLRLVDQCSCAYGMHIEDGYTTEVNPYFENRFDAVNKTVQFIDGLCPEGDPHETT